MRFIQGLLIVVVGVIAIIGGLAFVSYQEGKTEIIYGTVTKVEVVYGNNTDVGLGEDRYRLDYSYTYNGNSGTGYKYVTRSILNKPKVGDEIKVIIDLSTGMADDNLKEFKPEVFRIVVCVVGGVLCLAGVAHMFGMVSTTKGRWN